MAFGKRDQFATVMKFNVRVKDERENDQNHLVEVTLEMLLTHELADDIMPAMVGDLFQEVAGGFQPKPELKEGTFNVTPTAQIMTVRQHPDLDPICRIEAVTLRKFKAKKSAANAWLLQMTATWGLGSDVEAVTMIRALKAGLYFTFEAMQQRLPDPGQAPENDATATVDGHGNVVDIKKGRGRKPAADKADKKDDKAAGGKKRGGRRRNPEAEAAAQVEHGRAVGDVAAGEGEPAAGGGDTAGGGDEAGGDGGGGEPAGDSEDAGGDGEGTGTDE